MTEVAPAPAPAPSPAPSPAPAPAPAPSDSYDWSKAGLSEDNLGYVRQQGFKDPETLAKSYRDLTKLTGDLKSIVKLPKDDSPEAWNQVYDSLGRPRDPAEYKLPVPEGDKGEFAGVASKWMHEAGLNPKQAQLLATKWNDHIKGMTTAQRTEMTQKSAADEVTLKQEWGAKYDENVGLAKRAAQQLFKLDGPTVDKLEGAIGHASLMRLMHAAGTKLGVDDSPIGMDGNGGTNFPGAQSPAAAKARIAELRKDPVWTKAWAGGDVQKRAELNRLTQIASAGG
jgi:hypothetical protein